jgi:hypothetical protein
MTHGSEPRPLSEIAVDAGLNMSDVAMFSGLDESTVYRLWDNPRWLDRVSGRSLQSLIASVPGIAEYSTRYSLHIRRRSLVNDLQSEGLTVDPQALENSPIPQQRLLNTLEAGLHIVRGNASQRVASYLARFWGLEQDQALESLFSTRPGHGLLTNPHTLFESSIDLAPRLNRKSYSFHSILSLNILTHQVSKVTGGPGTEPSFASPGRQNAFRLRGVVMGALIGSNDLDLAERYRMELDRTPIYAAVEEWSFPTYTRDGKVSSDFTLPNSLFLRNTAQEVLREIAEYNDAYFYYLVSTYIPLALRRDPSFGARLGELTAAIERRAADCRERRIRLTCATLVKQLKGMA